jgi:hypothetical protein
LGLSKGVEVVVEKTFLDRCAAETGAAQCIAFVGAP